MATIALDLSEGPSPSFAALLASRLPIGFLNAVKPSIDGSYDVAYKGTPLKDGSLPYLLNLIPHNRNRLAFELLHDLATTFGMTPTAKVLDNGYHYLEIESKGLTLHVKHRNNYQTLKEQMVKADYRRAMTGMNSHFGQMPLFTDDKPVAIPDQIYAIMFFEDSASKRGEAGDVYFILPSKDEGNILAYEGIDAVIASSMPKPMAAKSADEDTIPLPSKRNTDDKGKAK